MKSLTVDRQKIVFFIPDLTSKTMELKPYKIASNRLVVHLTPQSEKDDSWVVVRSKQMSHALALLTLMLSARKNKKTLSSDFAVASWSASWDTYLQSLKKNTTSKWPITVHTSQGLMWGDGIDPHFITMEKALKGGQITDNFLNLFGNKIFKSTQSIKHEYESKRSLVFSITRRHDIKITIWNRAIQGSGSSMSFIVPTIENTMNTSVAVDLAAKYAELFDNISLFHVMQQKYLVENDITYLKNRKDLNNFKRDDLLNLKTTIDRIVSSSDVQFVPEEPNIIIPD